MSRFFPLRCSEARKLSWSSVKGCLFECLLRTRNLRNLRFAVVKSSIADWVEEHQEEAVDKFWLVVNNSKYLVLGQVISMLIASTSVFCWALADAGIELPTVQYGVVYVFLCSFFCFEQPKLHRDSLAVPLWHYALWAFIDVEANYFMVLAFQYVSLVSIVLLDYVTLFFVFLCTRVLLRHQYTLMHVLVCVICMAGFAVTIIAESLPKGEPVLVGPGWNDDAPKKSLMTGIVCTFAGCCLYSISNVMQEGILKKEKRYSEALGMLGVCGSIIYYVQTLLLEGRYLERQLQLPSWDQRTLFALFGLQVSLFGVYVLVGKFILEHDALLLNLNLLTSDYYTLQFVSSIGRKSHWVHSLGFAITMGGLLLCHIKQVKVIQDNWRDWGETV